MEDDNRLQPGDNFIDRGIDDKLDADIRRAGGRIDVKPSARLRGPDAYQRKSKIRQRGLAGSHTMIGRGS